MNTQQVALFPIPGSVSFPNTQVPLHVFEPRYREMVHYCLSNNVMLGVCHTEKILHEKKPQTSMQEALKSNQSTYKPHSVFSIGDVSLLETLPDGRLHILVAMRERVRLVKEIQTLPFKLVEVEYLPDESTKSQQQDDAQLKEKIIHRMAALFASNAELLDFLHSPEIQTMPFEEFSFTIFTIVRLDPELQQAILEQRTPSERLTTLLDVLNYNVTA